MIHAIRIDGVRMGARSPAANEKKNALNNDVISSFLVNIFSLDLFSIFFWVTFVA